MAQMHGAVCIVNGTVRAASFWRAFGFPVPADVPDNALGTLTSGESGTKIIFSWQE